VSGRYAEGMKVELFAVKGDALQPLSAATIDAAGRADLASGRPLAVGQYELRFQLADYFRRRGVAVGDPPYLDYVPVRFSVDTPGGHYHVPLICTPWSYSTYRGS
jgi:hydroxyisourate hydrolase